MNDGVLDGVRERVVERVVDVDPHALPLVDPNVRLGVLGADLIDDVSHGAVDPDYVLDSLAELPDRLR